MKTTKYFHGPNAETFHLFSEGLATVMSVLNQGRTGELSSAIHASRKGYRITLGGRTLCRGKTPRELHDNFRAELDKLMKGPAR